MLDQEQAQFSEESRRQPRRKVLWSGELNCGDYDFDCKVYDISKRGAQVKLGLPLAPGAELMLQVGRLGEMPCRVAWQRDGRLGLLFIANGDVIDRKFGDRAEIFGFDDPHEDDPDTMH